MDGWWEAEALDETICRILSTDLAGKIRGNLRLLLGVLAARLFNFQSRARAYQIAERHYNLGNDLFQAMLDPRMVYTCAYFEGTDDLAEAQEKKLELVCRKLGLEAGQRVLDIGCGWGSFARYAAETHGVSVVGITVSREQVALAEELCRGLPVEIRLQDYRELDDRFDHIVSLGMFEHVGLKNYRTYMKIAERCLRPSGRFLLQTIGNNHSTRCIDPWIARYIFPNSMLPSLAQIGEAFEGLFVLDDVHSFGPYYDKTLMAWYRNFEKHWPQLRSRYSDRFYRMWRFYLLACAGIFRSRTAQLWQILLSKPGIPASPRYLRNIEDDAD